MSFRLKIIALAMGLFLLGASAAQAAVEIQWWHAMGGALGEKVNDIAAKFNSSQSQYKVKPVYKGNYTETMTNAIAAFRAKKQPHIVQVFEVGTASMMAAEGAVYPVHKLMADVGEPFDQKRYLAAVVGYYTTPEGKMLSMPFNSSTPVLYYNKDAFKKAGLDPDKPPKTWPELAEYSKKIIAAYKGEAQKRAALMDKLETARAQLNKSGLKDAAKKLDEAISAAKRGIVTGGFTTGWQSWVQIENFSAWHNVAIGSKSNGFEGLNTEFKFNSPLHVKHIQQMGDWQKQGIFKYGGRRSNGNPLFVNGEVAMLMNSSASRAGIKRGAKFDFGMSYLPYWPDIKKSPQNSIIGGATLWVLAGHPKKEYKAVAKFLSFLSKPEIQADWHQFTGYVPITYEAYELTKSQGYYKKNPGADVAIKQLNFHKPTQHSKGLRFGNFVQIRDIINEELETVWAGKKTAQKALDTAVDRGNKLLRKFEKANK
jgi:sn-glycerol 3-phosphate transport system substrate-binding protein